MNIRSTRRTAAAVAGALLAVTGAAGCSTRTARADPSHVDVVAAFYPLQFIAERVGGNAVRVSNLVKPGAEPHDLELNPGQVAKVSDAKVIVYLKGFQPAVDEAVEQNGDHRGFDVATVQPLLSTDAASHGHDGPGQPREAAAGGKDPHVWLDPTRLATIADRLAERLGRVDPSRAAGYRSRAAALRADLEALDKEYEQGLRTCQRRELVTSHEAFGYLAERYHLEQVGISGLTPETEPSARRLAEVATEAKAHGATTIFFETLVSPKVAETIATQVGAKAEVLDPIEGLEPGSTGDYLSVMRDDLTTLKTALGCS